MSDAELHAEIQRRHAILKAIAGSRSVALHCSVSDYDKTAFQACVHQAEDESIPGKCRHVSSSNWDELVAGTQKIVLEMLKTSPSQRWAAIVEDSVRNFSEMLP